MTSQLYKNQEAPEQIAPSASLWHRRSFLALLVIGLLCSLVSARGDEAQPHFQYRGMKGWSWTPEQYLEEIPTMHRLKLNFLMNCYGSMFTSAPGEPPKNEWWKPMTAARKAAYKKVLEACRQNDITFCFAMHPQISSPRPLNLESSEDFEQFFAHYAWAQSEGVHWFSVSLDDVSWGSGGPEAGGNQHAKFANAVFARLRQTDPAAQMIFCPGPYWGDGKDPKVRPYLEALKHQLNQDIYVFWTGDDVVTPKITRAAAESYKKAVGHRLFLWDNYPVNDAHPTMHLGPVFGRDPSLCELIDGYISNPMTTQNEINRLPLATCADYAWNPQSYNPERSENQAITNLAATVPQQDALRALVALYPGFLVTGGGTGNNPVRDKFNALASQGNAAAIADYIQNVNAVATRFAQAFPDRFLDARRTVLADVAWMNSKAGSKNP
jgi:hyaluronoglucosaminidase